MESWFGGGILFAVAAALWLAYLVPNWLQRREYLASERNAVRLQQTIRVLAETAEAPEAIRLENAAKARVIASKLTEQQVLAEARAAVDARAAAAARLRRTRLAATLVLTIALAVLAWQGWVAVSVGLEAVAGGAVLVAAVVAAGAAALQRRAHRTAAERAARDAARASRVPAAETRQRTAPPVRRQDGAAAPAPSRTWTPTPLPQPLSRVRREAMLAAARAEALGQAAGSAAEDARIAAAAPRRVTPTPGPASVDASSTGAAARPAPARPRDPAAVGAAAPVATVADRSGAPNRYAAMGIIDDGSADVALDLDAALARRRAS